MNDQKKVVTRQEKLKALSFNENLPTLEISDAALNIIYKKFMRKDYAIPNGQITRIDKLKALGLPETYTTLDITNTVLCDLYRNLVFEPHCEQVKKDHISRDDMLTAIGLSKDTSEKKLDNDILLTLYEDHLKKKNQRGEKATVVKQALNDKLQKGNPNYDAVLDFLNALLPKLKKKPIKSLIEFKNIRRDDLLTDECNEVLNEHIDKLVNIFGKNKLKIAQRDSISSYIITVIKNIVSLCGYNLTVARKQVLNKQKDGSVIKDAFSIYSIT